MENWVVTPRDRELFDRELDAFLPPQIYDFHAHWYDVAHFRGQAPPLCSSGPAVAGADAYLQRMDELTPGRAGDGLFFPFPHPQTDVDAANRFLADQLTRRPRSRGLMLVTPATTPDQIRDAVARHRFVGLKCYHVYSPCRPTWESPVDQFLPDAQLDVADELSLVVMLHIVRAEALADPLNQQQIVAACRNRPNLKLVLAHAARGFNPHHTVRGIAALAGLSNVWFDSSVVTDSGALEAILQTFGPARLLYGSDFPVSHLRGRCVAVGDSFFWLSPDNTRLDAPYAPVQFTLVGLEALRTLKTAALSQRLSDSQIEAVFHQNALRLLDIA